MKFYLKLTCETLKHNLLLKSIKIFLKKEIKMAKMTVAKRNELLEEWADTSEKIKELRAKEAELRTKIVENLFDPEKVEGTENLELGAGYKLKCVKKQNYKLSNKDGQLEKAIDKLEEIIADRLIIYKAEISVREYKQLDDKSRKIIDKVLTVSPATPSVSIVEPKEA